MKQTNRRDFLKIAGLTGTGLLLGMRSGLLAGPRPRKLTILHTNDTHSRIEPYPASHATFPGMGGYARRAAIIRHYRKRDPGVLVLDAGDIFQGTPYYNMYGGEPELILMSKMGYDAATVGNHEFDNGLDGFHEVLPHARFPFVSSNYDFSSTLLKGQIRRDLVLERNGIRVGIYGLGIDPRGLVSRHLYGDTVYHDPIEVAREVEKELKQRGCELIICLSHLGYQYDSDRVSDRLVARETRFTDIIIGGHTHSLLDPPAVVFNREKQVVHIGQAGYGGVYTGYMEVVFEPVSTTFADPTNTTKKFKSQVL